MFYRSTNMKVEALLFFLASFLEWNVKGRVINGRKCSVCWANRLRSIHENQSKVSLVEDEKLHLVWDENKNSSSISDCSRLGASETRRYVAKFFFLSLEEINCDSRTVLHRFKEEKISSHSLIIVDRKFLRDEGNSFEAKTSVLENLLLNCWTCVVWMAENDSTFCHRADSRRFSSERMI